MAYHSWQRYRATTTLAGRGLWMWLKSSAMQKPWDHKQWAGILQQTLSQMKGPALKIGQILSLIPHVLPDEYEKTLETLQSHALPMPWSFVRRCLVQELGQNWQALFPSFEKEARFAASLGQVHKATTLSQETVACKIQYPHMHEAVKTDLNQLRLILQGYQAFSQVIDPSELFQEVEEHLWKELDYHNEACLLKRMHHALRDLSYVHVPYVHDNLSTSKLLVMDWVEGIPLQNVKDQADTYGLHLFYAWYYPLFRYNLLHGDPHFGNYRFHEDGSLTLLDFGCVREFSPSCVQGVIELYQGLKLQDQDRIAHSYHLWGFKNLNAELIEALTQWARFLYTPLLYDGLTQIDARFQSSLARTVYQALKKSGGVCPPKTFVFLDRAALGIGAALMRLGSRHNWHQAFEELISFHPAQ